MFGGFGLYVLVSISLYIFVIVFVYAYSSLVSIYRESIYVMKGKRKDEKRSKPQITFGEGFLSGSFGLQAWNNHLFLSSCFSII